jgi:hypothetical protein
MNLLENGLRWLADKQKTYASVWIEYRHGNQSFTIVAWFGQTKIETTDESGFRITSHITDFLIRSKDLPVTPALGDEIITNSSRYEVLELPGDSCWCWSDPFHTVYRIHVKEIGVRS